MTTMSRFVPKDRTATNHYARIDRVVFTNPDGPFTIALGGDGGTVMGPTLAEELEPGVTYRFLGRWEDDPQRGYRFRFTTFMPHALHSRSAVVKYLCDVCEGIGPKAAEKLWTAYGGQAIDELRECPYEVAAKTGINEEVCLDAAEVLTRERKFQDTKIELHDLFKGRGFQGKLIGDCIDRWGAKAGHVVRANPFRLLNMTSAGFKRCDKLYLDCGCNPSAIKRQAICAANLVRTARDGHTWFDAHEIASRLMDLIPGANPVKAFKLGIRARLLDKHRDESGKLWITTTVRAYCERAIVDHVRRLTAVTGSAWPTDRIPVSQNEGDRLPSVHQVERLTLATAGRVGLFIGGPGTGKSHTLAYLLKEVIADHGAESVAVCAPTGKAALRAGQALKAAGVNIPTSTIHSLLIACGAMSLDGADGDDMDGFGGVEGKLDCRYLVVDEASMIDTSLKAVLLGAVPTGCHVLFVGDPYQLPPVGHGSPLRDLIAAGLPCGELTQVRRNAGQIVHACLRIKNGEDFETTDRVDLAAEPPRNLRIVEARDEKAQAEMLSLILGGMKGFDPAWGCQVIVARNKGGEVTRKPLNDRLQAVLNPDGYAVEGNPFRVGDKVICLKNGKQQVVEFDPALDSSGPEGMDPRNYHTRYTVDRDTGHREPVQVRVMNGEIGRVVAVGAAQTIARFSERDELVRIPHGKSDKAEKDEGGAGGGESDGDDNGRGCNFDLGYAVTCHKLQGSEAPCVIVIADAQGGGVATREWWYTAVSRASKVCLIVGSRGVVDKQRARVSTTKRKTFLVEQLTQTTSEATDTPSEDMP
jgi:exodeoxyribonuclease V alpha subunit